MYIHVEYDNIYMQTKMLNKIVNDYHHKFRVGTKIGSVGFVETNNLLRLMQQLTENNNMLFITSSTSRM